MTPLFKRLAEQACRDIDLQYPGDAYPRALARRLIDDYVAELNKIKWISDDDGWNKAIASVRQEIKKRYLG